MNTKGQTRDFRAIDEIIRKGELERARAVLQGFDRRRLQSSERARLANLCRRAGLPQESILLLHPQVRHDSRSAKGSALEQAEYGAALTAIGAEREGAAILARIAPETHPPALLYYAFALFASWEYSRAIAPLKRYLTLVRQDAYSTLVGEINLAAAYLFEGRTREAERLLKDVRAKASAAGATLLLGNSLELSGQVAMLENDFKKAKNLLDLAADTLGTGGSSLSSLFVRKWQAIVAVKQSGNKAAWRQLQQVRAEAELAGFSETVRECDYYQTLLSENRSLLTRVYYGTPYPAYRARLVQELGTSFAIPDTFTWRLCGPGGGKRARLREFDMTLGWELGGGDRELAAGQLPHRLLQILSSDFYRPFRPASLFAALFPAEFFNPHSSIDRIHHTVTRLRQWVARAGLPFQIRSGRSGYFLASATGIAFRISKAPVPLGPTGVLWLRLKPQLRATRFDARSVAKALGLSKRSTLRFLKSAESAGYLQRVGGGRSVAYETSRAVDQDSN